MEESKTPKEQTTPAPAQVTTQSQATTVIQQQQGISAAPKLQQIISAGVQSPHIVSSTPKLQQIIVANPQQGDAPSPKLQQIITAAIQQQPSTSGSPQLKRISTKLTPSQLQQMISANPQQFQVVRGVGSNANLQQIVVTTTPQLQQIVTSTTQLQPVQQVQKTGTISTPVLQGVIASTQAQQGLKPVSQILQGLKTTAQLHTGVKTTGTPQLTKIVSQPTATQLQNIKTAQAQLQQLSASSHKTIKVQSAGGQIQHVIKTVVTQPQMKTVISNPQSTTAPMQTVKTAAGQVHGLKTLPLLQQSGKAGTQVLQQTVQVVKSQGVTASPQLQTTQKTVSVPQTKPQGVTATPRLQQMVATPPKKKEKPPKPTCMGEVVGKLSQGSRHVKRFKEDRRNIAKSVKYLSYGAFGSYAPSYDSSFANLSKEESDLINGSYTDFEPSEQIRSILSNDSDYTFTLADNLLEMFGGKPKKIKLEVEDPISDAIDESLYVDSKEGILPKTEEDDIQALQALGIDLSHLAALEETFSKDEDGSPEIQQKLEYTTGLIRRLQQMQYDRLSVNPHPRLGHQIAPPSDAEIGLAKEITGNLSELTKRVPPGALVIGRVRTMK